MTTKKILPMLPIVVHTNESHSGRELGMGLLLLLDRALMYGLFFVLVFGVLAFGCVEDWSTFGFELGALGLFLTWSVQQLLSRKVKLSANPLCLPAFLFLALVLAQLGLHRSAYAYATSYEVLRYVAYGIVLLVTMECVRTKESRKRFALLLTVFGAFYAFFAVIQDLTSNGKIFWLRTVRFHGVIFGTYVNRDHYAGLMEMLLPIPLTLSMSHLLRGERRILAAFCGVLMAGTIFLCGSRGGMIAFMLEMVLLAILTFRESRRFPAVAAYVLLCISTVGFIFLSSDARLARIGDLDAGIRPQILKDSLKMFAQRPILGWGLATFPTVYPQYRSFYTNLFVNEAHNDYAQVLVETGILGFSLMIWFIVQLYRRGFSQLQDWQNRWDRALSVSALTACTGILVHSLVDFNLHIPANAAFFYASCGLAASDLQMKRCTNGAHRHSDAKPRTFTTSF
jgi:O-antigen ligase